MIFAATAVAFLAASSAAAAGGAGEGPLLRHRDSNPGTGPIEAVMNIRGGGRASSEHARLEAMVSMKVEAMLGAEVSRLEAASKAEIARLEAASKAEISMLKAADEELKAKTSRLEADQAKLSELAKCFDVTDFGDGTLGAVIKEGCALRASRGNHKISGSVEIHGDHATHGKHEVHGHHVVNGGNLYVHDGSGSARCAAVDGHDSLPKCSGAGNVFVGHAPGEEATVHRGVTGSHNIVLGVDHRVSSHGAIVSGANHTVAAPHASAIGGLNNTAQGHGSLALGGSSNIAGWNNHGNEQGEYAVVLGGYNNAATGSSSSVTGGKSNVAGGQYCSISGGRGNEAHGPYSSVSGGQDNLAWGRSSSVSGGENNRAGVLDNVEDGQCASVLGGRYNVASGEYSSVLGGGAVGGETDNGNVASGNYATVSGGSRNVASGQFSSVLGGGGSSSGGTNYGNEASGYYATVTGGGRHNAKGDWSTIQGGYWVHTDFAPGGNWHSLRRYSYDYDPLVWSDDSSVNNHAYLQTGQGGCSGDGVGDSPIDQNEGEDSPSTGPRPTGYYDCPGLGRNVTHPSSKNTPLQHASSGRDISELVEEK